MTLVSPPPTAVRTPTAVRERLRRGWFAALREALDRPLTAYYLLLGASALLLTIGLIMVLSASSVYSLRYYDVFWATMHGLVVLHLAGKLPAKPDFRTIQQEAMRVLVAGARSGVSPPPRTVTPRRKHSSRASC